MQWSRPIPKERVLILVGVMDDLGADRGLIVAESGFQAGAIRASLNTSATLTSLDDLATNTAHERTQIQLAALKSRIASLRMDHGSVALGAPKRAERSYRPWADGGLSPARRSS